MHLRASGEGSSRADRGDEDSSRELHFDIIFCFNLLSRTNCESNIKVKVRFVAEENLDDQRIRRVRTRTLKLTTGRK
jgi:hypothetical protein